VSGSRPTGALHGVLVTFGRPDSLATILEDLAHAGLDSLTVVDNAPSSASARIVADAAARFDVTYVPMTENTGPAGGIAEGMTRVLAVANDDDWIVTLDDDGLAGSRETPCLLRDFGEQLLRRGVAVGAVGLVGARFDKRSGRLVRPRDEELVGAVPLDYIAGGQLLTIRVAAARRVGIFDASLFFAFDDLDYCLRLARDGYSVFADGSAWLDERRRHGRTGSSVARASRRISAWRRYYSVRNRVVIMQRFASRPRAAIITAGELFGRPIADLVRRQRGWWELTIATWRGCVDAWIGRLGRRMEPPAPS